MSRYDNIARAKEIIEKRRVHALTVADMRNEEVRAKSDRIAKIDEELTATGPAIFKAAIRGEDITPIKQRNLELNAERKKELAALGLPEDYTEIRYHCKACSDTGYTEDGRLCSCFRKEISDETIKSSGIGRLIERQSFDNFDIEWYKGDPEAYQKMKDNLEYAKQFSREFSKTGETLFLFGTTGTGKTHLSSAIAKEAILGGYEVIYDSVQNIISDYEYDRFKSGYGPYEPRSTKYIECDLLIIDDLGTEFVNQFTLSCIYNILNTRQNRGLATVVSTNLTTNEFSEKYEARISSRLFGNETHVLKFIGPDHRLGNFKRR